MTHANAERDDLYEQVRSLIREKFPDGLISEVIIKEDVGEDGEPILLITAVFEGPTDRFLQEKPTGLIRLLRNKLVEVSEFSFPMLSFVSSAEASF